MFLLLLKVSRNSKININDVEVEENDEGVVEIEEVDRIETLNGRNVLFRFVESQKQSRAVRK